jgi:phosphate:Na+ symporter
MSLVYLLGIAGHVALLLWGTHMVTSGLLRGFGHKLQPWLERHLGTRFSAFLSGLGLTTLLQSSTATGLMTASFAARGIMTLATGMAVMLGANVGTALVAKVLSFDINALAPILILLGFIGFRSPSSNWKQWGRSGIGLGLMLFALHGLMETLLPLEHNDSFTSIMSALNNVPWILLFLALGLTWMCHSSVAVVLFTASLSQIHIVQPIGLLFMVLGANIGGAIPPLLETSSVVGKRIPLGNAMVRVMGVLLVCPFLGLIANNITKDSHFAVDFHIGFNIILAFLAMPVLPVIEGYIMKILPSPPEEDAGNPIYLDGALKTNPTMVLTAATREVLRVVEMADVMMKSFDPSEKPLTKDQSKKLDFAIEKLGLSIRHYLSDLDDENMPAKDRLKLDVLRKFTIQTGHLTDVMLQEMEQMETAKKLNVKLGEDERKELLDLYKELKESWQIMVSVLMNPSDEAAQELQNRKTHFRILEERAEKNYDIRTSKLTTNENTVRQGSFYFQMLRNLRRVHSHIVSCAYPILDHDKTEVEIASSEPQGT